MIDLALIVEGETEELFVNRVLAPAFWTLGIHPWPVLCSGSKSWARVRRDAEHLLKQRRDRYCSVLFDYYALPNDWPGRIDAEKHPAAERGQFIEEALAVDLISHFDESFRRERFLPHIQVHEYEARLFADCKKLADVLGLNAAVLEKIVSECGSPEAINDNRDSAPSKRLDQICRFHTGRGYRKTSDGVTAAEHVTLAKMRSECPHFAMWLARVESISPRIT